MDLRDWIAESHRDAGGFVKFTILDLVPPERWAERPAGVANSILWSLWHIARTEDLAINTIVRGEPQELVAGGWAGRLGVAESRIGTGLDDDEVGELSSNLDPGEVRSYWRAVRASTREWLQSLTADDLDAVPDVDARLDSAPGALPPAGAWLRDFWRGRPAGFFVRMPTITHTYIHMGEMLTVRRLLGIEPAVR